MHFLLNNAAMICFLTTVQLTPLQQHNTIHAPHCQQSQVIAVIAADNHRDHTNDESQLRFVQQILDQDQVDQHKELRVAARQRSDRKETHTKADEEDETFSRIAAFRTCSIARQQSEIWQPPSDHRTECNRTAPMDTRLSVPHQRPNTPNGWRRRTRPRQRSKDRVGFAMRDAFANTRTNTEAPHKNWSNKHSPIGSSTTPISTRIDSASRTCAARPRGRPNRLKPSGALRSVRPGEWSDSVSRPNGNTNSRN